MAKKVLSYSVVGLLAVALLAGSAYILLKPGEVQAGQGSPGGRGQGREAAVESGGSEPEVLNRNAYGRSETAQGRGVLGDGAFGTEGAFEGRGRSSGTGQGRNETVRTVEWETLTGEVTITGFGLETFQTMDRLKAAETQAGEHGAFRIEGLEPGTYTVLASAIGTGFATKADALANMRSAYATVAIKEGTDAEVTLSLE